MAVLLAGLGPAGRVGAWVRPCATWLLGATTPCAPLPLALALLLPRPDARLLRTADLSQATETTGSSVSCTEEKKQSKSQQLKKIFQEYDTVGVSLYTGISLISLVIFYMVVSSGVDMSAVLLKLGFKESLVQSKMAAGTSTFVVAYAIHKLFAPVRISITLVSFRKVGFFKTSSCKTLMNSSVVGTENLFLLNYTIWIGFRVVGFLLEG
uniref:DUF1279 domain-containing protein n=1 Tax=Pan paniscus TaxID=9597 RepID=A0A2R9CCH7_PANPA